MLEAPIPPDEVLRLETLRRLSLLDSEAEERFDRLTRMARRVFNVPIALVSLVDEDRQWFKSCIGLEVRETARDISFCGHAIMGNETFIVPDASQDPRFADNPLVVGGPGIRFYAGQPLRIANGCKLGTLCIIDTVPRELSEEDVGLLKDLAAMVVRELEAVQLATIDELTLISNRRGFVMLAEKSLSLASRLQMPLALLYLDLNGFKGINDRWGHAEGDRALIAFATLLKQAFRGADVFARMGGDEFAVLLPNVVEAQAQLAYERFNAILAEHNQHSGCGYALTCSTGIVCYDGHGCVSLAELLTRADELMYQRKRDGKG
ncbi:sensor domain-containing diguanylate cyclase [Aeromonas veronii]|uniref:sensor domain-containing diguanylate cyclase n=1 Tax=Aeromonas veronii TaxID=654 RepID=UPI002B4A1D4B|nr:sensor domain-containing diguanylate cyclase [Aeromonas veronii]